MSTDNRTLPKKEQDLFKSLVKYYETKQYKKGIKAADGVLKKFPNHGETLAMKGLTLNSLSPDKKEEAQDLIKKGLRNDVRSHVCWHVFGLFHRADRNYKEAIKCYLNALRIDSENQQILRDLSWLQIQLRDMNGFVETRRNLLMLKPSMKQQWVAYAVANYVAGNLRTAYEVVAKYLETTVEKEESGYELSELMLFQNRCIEDQLQYNDAISHLENNAHNIVDKLSMNVKKAELLVRAGRFSEARQAWLSLVKSQPSNYRFHAGLQTTVLELDPQLSIEMFALKRLELPSTTLILTSEQIAKLTQLYKTILPPSSINNKILLTLLTGNELEQAIGAHLKKGLRDGVPALYNDICSLIRIPDPRNSNRNVFAKDPYEIHHHPITILVTQLLTEYIKNLKEFGTFHSSPVPGDIQEVPTALLWSLFLYCHLLEKSGKLNEARQIADEMIQHTPTALDVYVKKAKILRKQGDVKAAAVVMEECRLLDLQDRYLNNKTTKTMLRADYMDQAMDTIALFTKHDGDPQQALFDLQCVWYELEAGESYARTGNTGLALKKFYAVEKHFIDYVEDQFDFHGFCLRKTTLRAYIEVLKMEDNIYAHRFLQRAARGAMRVLLRLLDPPVETSDDSDVDLSKLSAADRRKEKAKLRKLKKKETTATTTVAEKNVFPVSSTSSISLAASEDSKKAAGNKGGGASGIPKDEDPLGLKLLALDPLEELARWSAVASQCLSYQVDPDTQALVSEVSIRRGKVLLALRSLTTGLRACPHHPQLTVQLVRLAAQATATTPSPAPSLPALKPVVVELLQGGLATLMGGVQVTDFVASYAEAAKHRSLSHRLAALRCLAVLHGAASTSVQTAAKESLVEDEGLWSGRGLTVTVLTEAYQMLLNEVRLDANLVDSFLVKCRQYFPVAVAFQSETVTENESLLPPLPPPSVSDNVDMI